jgi:hypothetical protein
MFMFHHQNEGLTYPLYQWCSLLHIGLLCFYTFTSFGKDVSRFNFWNFFCLEYWMMKSKNQVILNPEQKLQNSYMHDEMNAH